MDFLAACCHPAGAVQTALVYHVARKKVPHVSADGAATCAPAAPNAVKLEAFIFDVYAYADAAAVAVLEGERAADFAPVKNAEGTGWGPGGDRGGAASSALLKIDPRVLPQVRHVIP